MLGDGLADPPAVEAYRDAKGDADGAEALPDLDENWIRRIDDDVRA